MHKSKIILSGWIKSMSSQLQPHFHLMKINIIWGSMEMRIIYCWGFRSTLCWLHDIDWVAFCRTLSPYVTVSSAFVATNWNDKIIYIYFYMKTKLWCIMLLHQGPANTITIKHLVREKQPQIYPILQTLVVLEHCYHLFLNRYSFF